MELCPACRKLLYRTDPCKGSGECGRTDGGSKSTAARKDVPASLVGTSAKREASAKRQDERPRTIAQSESARSADCEAGELANPPSPAGTQAPHVDTPKRGRPRTGFDKKAYDRIKAAERRAKIKAGK